MLKKELGAPARRPRVFITGDNAAERKANEPDRRYTLHGRKKVRIIKKKKPKNFYRKQAVFFLYDGRTNCTYIKIRSSRRRNRLAIWKSSNGLHATKTERDLHGTRRWNVNQFFFMYKIVMEP